MRAENLKGIDLAALSGDGDDRAIPIHAQRSPIFDIVFVMTNGQFDTQVIANRMFTEMFTFRDFGRGSAIAVLLLICVLPVMISNIRNLQKAKN